MTNQTTLTSALDRIPGKIDIKSSSGRIHIFRESGGGADWRIGLNDHEGEWITTEFACHGMRSPYTVHAMSFGLRTLDEAIHINPVKENISVKRLSDQDFILVTITLTNESIHVILERKNNGTHHDCCKIEVSATVSNTQYIFFQRLVKAMQQDNQENPL